MNAQHIQIDSLNARFGNRVLRADEVTKCRLMGVLPCDCGCGLPTMLMYFIRIEGNEIRSYKKHEAHYGFYS